MMSEYEISADQLYQRCETKNLDFKTTADLETLDQMLGQDRALESLMFGVGIAHEGYNLFIMGPTGLGKHHTVRQVLGSHTREMPVPPDWCYINNFNDAHKPHALRLPPGTGSRLQRDLYNFVRELLVMLPAAFDTDEYRKRLEEINDEFKGHDEELFNQIAKEASRNGVTLVRTLTGFTIAPVKNGEVMDPAEFQKLPDAEKEKIRRASDAVQQSLRQAMQQSAAFQREHAQRLKQLNQEVARHQVDLHFIDLEKHYEALPDVVAFLNTVRSDVLERAEEFRQFANENQNSALFNGQRMTPFNRYFVNVLVDHEEASGAPVVYEDNPTYQNLMGRVEHLQQMGTLLTDFNLIKAGAFHRANGGYLLLDANKLLLNPFAWEALKRVLRARELRIQSMEQMLSLGSTISLEPEPIPLDVKVVLFGERMIYYLLSEYDPDFAQLFKVAADFSEDMPRSAENTKSFARLIATMQRRQGLLDLHRSAVVRLVEHAARLSQDNEKLALDVAKLQDLLQESDHWARQRNARLIEATHVEKALDAQEKRVGQLRIRSQEMILRGVRKIATEGAALGEINGLAVISIGKYAFGTPSRITATARLGDGSVIDIEREAKLGQPLHSKGVLILSSFLANRFGQDLPLAVAASLVFEQSYGWVEGDSASTAELCALLSSLSGLPLRQDLAITGSVDQHGAVQAIGGVNEKIEGFFDICNARGLTGSQGVIVPVANKVHLMVHPRVVEAVRQGRFHVYGISHVDEAMTLFTGRPAGESGSEDRYPADSVNFLIQDRLHKWARLRQDFAKPKVSGPEAGAGGQALDG